MNEHLRIGDAERDRAAADLGEHYAEGRLTAAEHAERLDRIWAARTRADLAPVFADLPARHPHSVGREPFAGRGVVRRGGPSPLVLGLAGLLVVLTVVTHLPLVLIALVLFVVVRRHRRRTWLPSGT